VARLRRLRALSKTFFVFLPVDREEPVIRARVLAQCLDIDTCFLPGGLDVPTHLVAAYFDTDRRPIRLIADGQDAITHETTYEHALRCLKTDDEAHLSGPSTECEVEGYLDPADLVLYDPRLSRRHLPPLRRLFPFPLNFVRLEWTT